MGLYRPVEVSVWGPAKFAPGGYCWVCCGESRSKVVDERRETSVVYLKIRFEGGEGRNDAFSLFGIERGNKEGASRGQKHRRAHNRRVTAEAMRRGPPFIETEGRHGHYETHPLVPFPP